MGRVRYGVQDRLHMRRHQGSPGNRADQDKDSTERCWLLLRTRATYSWDDRVEEIPLNRGWVTTRRAKPALDH